MVTNLNMPQMRQPCRFGESFICSKYSDRLVLDIAEVEVELPHVLLVEYYHGFGPDLPVHT